MGVGIGVTERAHWVRGAKCLPRVFLWIAVYCVASSGGALCATIAERETILGAVLDAALADPILAGAAVGVRLEAGDGRVVYERNGDLRLMPASGLKLVTGGCALDLLGRRFTAVTEVVADAPVVGGVLDGPVYLRGGGDPSLDMAALEAFARAIAAAGVRTIRGDVCGDETLFGADRFGVNWSVQHLERYYAAPVSALSLNKNVIDFWFLPGPAVGAPARFRTEPGPGGAYLALENRSVTTSPADTEGCTLYLRRLLWTPRVLLVGTIPVDYQGEFEEAVTVTEPAHFAASMLHAALGAAGIAVEGRVDIGTTPVGGRVLAQHSSAPFEVLMQRLLKRSDNHYAELMLRHLSVSHGDGAGTRADGERVVRDWLARFVCADPDDVVMADGSGLSRLNLTTARVLCGVLQYMQRHKDGRVFRDALSCGGVDGTLHARLLDSPARGMVWGKTGYIDRVRTIAGYLVVEGEGAVPVFSIQLNHYLAETAEVTRLQDRMVQAMAAWATGLDAEEIRRAGGRAE